MTFAIGRHALVDLAYTFRARREDRDFERLDAATFDRLRDKVSNAGLDVAEPEEARAKLGELRELYEPYADALSRRLALTLPAWVREERMENWRVAAWRTREAQVLH